MGKGREHARLNRALAKRVKDLRDAKGVTQSDLANRLGKTQSFISKVERGQRPLDVVELRWWCEALGADSSKIVKDWMRTT